ncbi:hypothetical protein [Rathayibacter rathayi]|uniref:hypothetical protein n=1 Tax=Rathayibacter rathayi TaxID=33887 RepID=UPI000BC6FDCF|nr:hypothetical protein [Rathayibacter rathayi]SOE05976.1 hypothetical protein SAMN06295924_12021 [Rathayibacter rathayi NCPPB 2980 = VKM Ac-1601]
MAIYNDRDDVPRGQKVFENICSCNGLVYQFWSTDKLSLGESFRIFRTIREPRRDGERELLREATPSRVERASRLGRER